MDIRELVQDIQTLSKTQQESVYSFVYLLKHPDYLRSINEQNEKVEPFETEREVLDFVNDYAGTIIHEAW